MNNFIVLLYFINNTVSLWHDLEKENGVPCEIYEEILEVAIQTLP